MPPVSETLWDRLHAERQRKAEQIAQMRAQRDHAELDECTFVPKLLSKPSASADGDVWDRLYKDTEETQVRDKLRWVGGDASPHGLCCASRLPFLPAGKS